MSACVNYSHKQFSCSENAQGEANAGRIAEDDDSDVVTVPVHDAQLTQISVPNQAQKNQRDSHASLSIFIHLCSSHSFIVTYAST